MTVLASALPTRARGAPRLCAAALVAVAAVAVAAWLVASAVEPPPELPGVETPSLNELLRLSVRAVGLLAACGTIGCLALGALLAAEVAVPVRLATAAAGWAALWALSSAWLAVLALRESGQATSLVIGAWVAAAVAVLARGVRDRTDARDMLAMSVLALVPGVLGAYSDHAGPALLALGGLLVHVVAVSVWVGAVLALALHTPDSLRADPDTVGRFSRLALGCYTAVAVSGAGNTWSSMVEVPPADASGHLLLLTVKVFLLAVLGGIGWWHRRRTLPRLAAGDPGPFRSLILAEVAIVVAALGVAAALGQVDLPSEQAGTGPAHAPVAVR